MSERKVDYTDEQILDGYYTIREFWSDQCNNKCEGWCPLGENGNCECVKFRYRTDEEWEEGVEYDPDEHDGPEVLDGMSICIEKDGVLEYTDEYFECLFDVIDIERVYEAHMKEEGQKDD